MVIRTRDVLTSVHWKFVPILWIKQKDSGIQSDALLCLSQETWEVEQTPWRLSSLSATPREACMSHMCVCVYQIITTIITLSNTWETITQKHKGSSKRCQENRNFIIMWLLNTHPTELRWLQHEVGALQVSALLLIHTEFLFSPC